MKAITIAGGLTRDAVTRTTQAGEKVTGFSVAVSEGFGDSKRSLYFDCSLWGARGEKLAQYLTKGSRVAVSGDLSTREHEGKTYLTVRASEVSLMGGGQRDDNAAREGYQSGDLPGSVQSGRLGSASAGGYGGGMPGDIGDEIPFFPPVL